MATQYYSEKKLCKKTKPKTFDVITKDGILEDGDESRLIPFAKYYEDFIGQPVTMGVTIASKEDVEQAETSEEE